MILGAIALLVAYTYLHFHPGYLTRPKVGSSYSEMMSWLDKNDYSVLSLKTASKKNSEVERETEREPENLRRYEERLQNNTLLSIGRLHRQQSLCGAGQYFVYWRFDAQEKVVEEIYYDDQFCYI